MKTVVLGSGSSGNCTYIETASAKIVIDCGFPYKEVRRRMEIHGLELNELDAILITHEHADHVSGLGVLLGKHPTKVYMLPKTYENLHFNQKSRIQTDQLQIIGETFQINHCEIEVVRTSHDAAEPAGFILKEDNVKLVHVTDTGYLPIKLLEPLVGADIYHFESNYDPELLFNSERPFYLKQRIMGNLGHLSNEASALLLNRLITENTKHICFIHLSEETNSVDKAIDTHAHVMERYADIEIQYSHQHKPSSVMEVIK